MAGSDARGSPAATQDSERFEARPVTLDDGVTGLVPRTRSEHSRRCPDTIDVLVSAAEA